MLKKESPRVAMATAFKQTVLSLIGVFQIHEVDPEVSVTVADVLGQVFRRHLERASPRGKDAAARNPMYELADELDRASTTKEHT